VPVRGVDEDAVVSAAAARRVGVTGLAPLRVTGLASQGVARSGTEPMTAGLVLGFANLSPAAIRRGVELLAEAVRAA
jgi:DNA-binding transcriptional MocR family regulator